jgi:hypothetical protein
MSKVIETTPELIVDAVHPSCLEKNEFCKTNQKALKHIRSNENILVE